MWCVRLLFFPKDSSEFWSFIQSVFTILYREFHNVLDFAFSEQSDLKCAPASTLQWKRPGQRSYPTPRPPTYIQDSNGWALLSLANLADPEGYELAFGPTNGAKNAFGVSLYIRVVFVKANKYVLSYHISTWASPYRQIRHRHLRSALQRSSTRPWGGCCRYFNIWHAIVNGAPTTYSCSFVSFIRS